MKNREDIYKITSIFFIIDQLIKVLVQKYMNLFDRVVVIPRFFSLYYVKNTGAAFSILENKSFLLILISVVFIVVFHEYIRREEKFTKMSIIASGLILGGIFGNLFDRIIYSAVIDYLDFTIFSYDFPVFNLADTGITVGIGLLMLDWILENKRKV